MPSITEIEKGLSSLKKQQEEIATRIRRGEKLLKETKKAEGAKVYQPRIEETIGLRSDYAGFNINGYYFYYGYEETDYHPLLTDKKSDEDKKTWAFTITTSQELIYKRAILPEHVEWNCLAGLIAGLGYWLENINIPQTKNVI